MDQGPLVRDQIEAGARFIAEFEKYVPVRVAFWLKDSEDRMWSLYIVSDQINDTNFDMAYGEVVRLAAEMRDPDFDQFQVKPIGIDDPVARAVLDLQQGNTGRRATRYYGPPLGGLSVEEVYIYPLPISSCCQLGPPPPIPTNLRRSPGAADSTMLAAS
jgi:hypothetical protein